MSRLMVRIALLLTCTQPPPAHAQASLIEAARLRGGDVTSIVNVEFPDADLKMLVADDTLVARGYVIDAAPRLTADRRNVETEYQFRITECLKCAGQVTGTVVRLVRLGGSMQLEDGNRVATQVQGFPDFDDRDDYILFLSPDKSGYGVRFGPYGAFRVRGQKAEHLAKSGWANGGVDVGELAKLVAQRPK